MTDFRAPSTDDVLAFEQATRDLVGVALRSVARVDVSLPQFRLLLVLDEMGPSSSIHCARALGVAASSITRLAERLHASGRLVRGTDPENRSVVTLAVTDAGRELVRQVTEHRRAELGWVLDRLDPASRTACVQAMRTVHDALGGESPDEVRRHLPL